MSENIVLPFQHRQSAHCESGVAANMLTNQGIATSEAMAFGIGAGLFFAYLPFIRLNKLPLVSYRAAAGHLLKTFARIPGFTLQQQTYSSREEAMAELDRMLGLGIPAGLQTGVYWLPYFPKALRFHFNAHNLVVYGREGNEYLISDPVFPEPVRCTAVDLTRARFASGALAPRGKMYYFSKVSQEYDRKKAILDGIDNVSRMMVKVRFPLIGVRGIRFLAGRLRQWPKKMDDQKADLHLGQVIRMQEEIGTGGGGFRFMYAAFLQECAQLMGEDSLSEQAERLILAGDSWREFAAMAARICKKREKAGENYEAAANLLLNCADLEEQIFTGLNTWQKAQP